MYFYVSSGLLIISSFSFPVLVQVPRGISCREDDPERRHQNGKLLLLTNPVLLDNMLKVNMMGGQVTPDKRKGLVSLYQDDQLMHFTWKDRSTGTLEDDLIIFPDDCEFQVMLSAQSRLHRNVTSRETERGGPTRLVAQLAGRWGPII